MATVPLIVFLSTVLFAPAAQASGGGAIGWGYDFFGQAGNGAPITTGCFCLPVPTVVGGIAGATQVSGGYYHTLALLSDGTARAWGRNLYGELGNGTTGDSAAPVPVNGLAGAISVAAGSSHGLALLSNGTVLAWGRNSSGQLGLGSTAGPESCGGTPCSKTPVPVPGLANVVAISAGSEYNLALLSNGSVVGWGNDRYGQLGDGTGVTSGCLCVDHPVPVPGVANAMAISAGAVVATALLADGTVRSWGRNSNGGLGNGTVTEGTPCLCLGPVVVSGLSGVRAVAAGNSHGMALLANGTVQAWGYNVDGQLGNGSTSVGGCLCVPSPAPVSGLAGVQEIAAGGSHGLALLADGSVRAWGRNAEGQLGDGGTGKRSLPGPVGGVGNASAVAGGEDSSFAQAAPSQGLTVALAGAGEGAVGGPKGIVCPPNCAGRYPQGQVEILRPEPAAGSAFAGFSGACTGTAPCQLKMEGDQAVTATFGPPKGTAITAATVDNKKRTAGFSFTAPGAITGYECQLTWPKKKAHHKKHKPKKHKPKGKGKGKATSSATSTPPPVFSPCATPMAYSHLRDGRYTFMVRALDSLGADATPASKEFTVKKPKPKKHRHRHKHKH